ncbi:hypothetical protein GCM10009601_28990 [Streptomyces thermospinosisporus]|uniref:Uncharacterized protein n=1 Tax=Streptomyces thermospinosisporus TaxID=161482 RepID=A0ABN1YY44_9ACTN
MRRAARRSLSPKKATQRPPRVLSLLAAGQEHGRRVHTSAPGAPGPSRPVPGSRAVFGHRDARSGLIGSLREGGTTPGGQPVTAREALGVAVSPSGSGGEPARRAEGGEARVWRAR